MYGNDKSFGQTYNEYFVSFSSQSLQKASTCELLKKNKIANGYFKTDMKMTFHAQKLLHSSVILMKDINSHLNLFSHRSQIIVIIGTTLLLSTSAVYPLTQIWGLQKYFRKSELFRTFYLLHCLIPLPSQLLVI